MLSICLLHPLPVHPTKKTHFCHLFESYVMLKLSLKQSCRFEQSAAIAFYDLWKPESTVLANHDAEGETWNLLVPQIVYSSWDFILRQIQICVVQLKIFTDMNMFRKMFTLFLHYYCSPTSLPNNSLHFLWILSQNEELPIRLLYTLCCF